MSAEMAEMLEEQEGIFGSAAEMQELLAFTKGLPDDSRDVEQAEDYGEVPSPLSLPTPPSPILSTASPLSSLPSRCCITPALPYVLLPPPLPRPSLCLIPPSCSRLTATPVSLAGG